MLCCGSTGGIAGYIYDGSIINCYNTGNISVSNDDYSHNNSYAGGIAGRVYNSSSIINCYNTGDISASNASTYISHAGGIAGYIYDGSIINCYYLNTVSQGIGQQNGNNEIIAEEKTQEEMRDQAFCEKLNINRNPQIDTAIWKYNKNSYPTLDVIPTNDLIITNKMTKTFTITKVDEETKAPLQNVKFAIYNTENGDFAKDLSGKYIGNQNKDGIYVVSTDENGQIKLSLPEGYYKAVEIETLKGYEIKKEPVYFSVGKTTINTEADIEINYIEDLVDFSNSVKSGNTYSGQTIRLMRTLDFNDDKSYRNPNDTSYRDYNGDNKEEGIKVELTSGQGFEPIGGTTTNTSSMFAGVFDGNGYEIKNLYINRSNYSYVGLFSGINNAKIADLGIAGNSTIIGGTGDTGAIVGYIYNSNIINCYNTGTVSGSSNVGGIAGRAEFASAIIRNCYNTGDVNSEDTAGGIIGNARNTNPIDIKACYNTGNIKASRYAGGITGISVGAGVTIHECYNRGYIYCDGIGGFFGYSGWAGGISGNGDWTPKIYNCYNLGTITGEYSGGIAVSNTHGGTNIANCYNEGTIFGNVEAAGISAHSSASIYNSYNSGRLVAPKKGGISSYNYGYGKNNVYLDSVCAQGIFEKDDEAGIVEAKTEEYMKSEDFCKSLNANINNIDTNNQFKDIIFSNWIYEEGKYPTLDYNLYSVSLEVTIENKKKPDDKETVITKVDKDTKEPISNVKFAIYNMEDNTFAKNKNGEYIGIKNENDIYTVTTDANGQLKLNLPEGYYKAVEIETIEGYQRKEEPTYFTVEKTTETEPDFNINNIEDLVDLSNRVNAGESFEGKTIKLMRTLDFNDEKSYRKFDDTQTYGNYNGDATTEGIKAELTKGTGFKPIGINSTYSFAGTFDGNGFEIRNIYINNSLYADIGLFGYVNGGNIKNIGLTGNIRNNYSYAGSSTGGIVGNANKTSITNCHNKANINITNSGDDNIYTGGIVGFSNGTIENCYNIANIYSYANYTGSYRKYSYTGGIAGHSFVISNSYNTGYVHNSSRYNYSYVGGITGSSDTIINCYNIGNTYSSNSDTSSYAYNKGITGSGLVLNSYWLSTTATDGAGKSLTSAEMQSEEFVKQLNDNKPNTSFVEWEYNQGDYPTFTQINFIEESEITITNKKLKEFTITKVDKETQNSIPNTKFSIYSIDESKEIIDFAKDGNGKYIGTLENDIYVVTTNESGKITLKLPNGNYKAVEVQAADGYVLEESEISRTTYFAVGEEDIKSESTENADLVINSIEDLVKFSNDVNSGNSYAGQTVVLARTLDFEDDASYNNPTDTSISNYNGEIKTLLTDRNGQGFIPIGRGSYNAFRGTFDGNNHELKNIYISNSGEGIGLFGYITNGKVRNLGLTGGGVITCNGSNGTGGIAGYIDNATIENSYNSIKINGYAYAGGIVGNSTGSENRIVNCYNSGTITMTIGGGIAGIIGNLNNGVIKDCYNTGNVSSDRITGGIVYSASNSEIVNCYNTGNSTSAALAGGIVYSTSNSKIINSYNLGVVTGKSGAGGIVYSASNDSNIVNCYNMSNVNAENGPAGGIVYSISNSKIINSYNTGNISSERAPAGGISYSITRSQITNCYNAGEINSGISITGGIVSSTENSTISNCYYLNTTASQGIYNQNDAKGIVEALSESDLKDNNFIKLLNNNKNNITSDILLLDWISNDNGYPTLELKPFIRDNEITITNQKIKNNDFVISKLDQETNTPIPNTKFAIYSTDSVYQTIDFAKDINGKIVGTQENGIYTIKTNENGKISLQLPDGYYKAVEVESAEGYILEESEDSRTIYFRIGTDSSGADITINYIEDLIELSNGTLAGNTYEGKTIKLLRNLDFNDDASYRNPEDTRFGDYNGDETIEGIKAELTNETGCGFKPIGTDSSHAFKGSFDGNGYEIKNIYINYSNQGVGLFGYIQNATITNLGISGNSVINSKGSSGTGALVGCADSSKIFNCYSSQKVSGYGNTGGLIGNANNCKILNSYNSGSVIVSTGVLGGLVGQISGSIVSNCYNKGNISVTSAPAGGIAYSISNTNLSNCYNVGEISSGVYSCGVGYNIDDNTKLTNIYYINTADHKGIYNKEDVEGSYEAKTQEEMQSPEFAIELNNNRLSIETTQPLWGWQYNENSYPTLMPIELVKGNEAIITNRKSAKITVHHYKQGTGPEFGTEPVILAPDETTIGSEGEEYTTSPKDNIEHYTLAKDENGENLIPDNATGTYKPGNQDVYYYYTRDPLNVIVHHYLEGTETKVPLGTNEDGEDIVAEDENYTYEEGEHYKVTPSEEVLKKYDLVKVVGNEEQEHITQDEEITYYYKLKEHQITTRVEITDGRSEKGGQITGEGETPYETVKHEESSVKEVVITPDPGYRVKQIRIVSTDEDENETETILYGKDAVETAEIAYRPQLDGSITLTQFTNMTEDKEIIVQFEPNEGKVIVHHYIENTEEKIHEDEITKDVIGKLVETKPVEKGNYVVVEEPEEKNVTITEEIQEKTYYYQEQYKITTDVIEHNETYKDGTVKKNVKGGTITDEDKDSHENVLKNRNSKDIIEMTPNEGYKIVKITINGKEYNFKDTIDENGKVTLPEGFFQNMQEDKHIEVEFRRKTKVIVKYLEEPEKQETEDGEEAEIDPTKAKVVAGKVIISGYEGQYFETIKKVIPNYKDSELGITDEKVEKTNPDGIMYADEITVIYWYTRVPSGIIVRHIETNEKAEEKEIESKLVDGLAGLEQPTTRNKYDKYIPVDRKEENKGNTNENVTIMGKDQNSKTLTFAENETLEVWYFYEKEYNVTTEVKPHEEKVLNEETKEYETVLKDGGTISKKYEKDEQGNDKLDDKGNKIETVYEKILSRGDSKEEIEIKPDDGYRIKTVIKQKKVIVNGKETSEDEKIFIENMIKEDGSVILPEGQLTDVQNDYNIVVEFERIPAKVIVEYKDAYTKETIHEDKEIPGFVNDKYNESRIEIENYIPADPEPENSEGNMTEETITVTYWYTKQFKITAEVKPHEEEEHNPETGETTVVQKDGGTIKIGEDLQEEIVTRGEDSTQKIIATPEDNYQIKEVTINSKKIEISNLIKEDGSLELPLFENMQEDKHIVVEFERIPAKVIVEHLDEETNEPIVDRETVDGYVTKDYETEPKDLKYYKLVEEKYPENYKGTMTEEDIVVKYYYKKLGFNMKVEKVIQSIKLNGQETGIDLQNNKYAKLEVEYKEIENTSIEVSYNIKVTNTEKVAGIAIVEEMIPEGFEFVKEESDENWVSSSEFEDNENSIRKGIKEEEDNAGEESRESEGNIEGNTKGNKKQEGNIEGNVDNNKENGDKNITNDRTYMLKTKELQTGETAEYKVALRWKAEHGNKGEKTNTAKIVDAENEQGYGETTLEDNEDKAIVEIRVKKTVQDVIDNIKDGKTDEAIKDAVDDVKVITKDVITSVKTGDPIAIAAIVILIAGMAMIVTIRVKRRGINVESKETKKGKHE